jgi:Resolvase, N terminal domain/Transposase
MTDAVLGIDVSKNTFDTNLGAGTKARSKSFANSPDGWHHLIAWLGEHKIGQVHACLEATGRHGLGIALALHEAGHVVSIVNPAQLPRPPCPAKILAEVKAGKIYTVVVYKVDRLTRSLADFAKLVELFDQQGVSFVSITQ